MTWADKIFANTLFISDLEKSKAFYSTVFEKSPVYEDENSVVYNFGNLLINLLHRSEAPSLIAPAQVAAPESGSTFQLTIQIDDVDKQSLRIQELGFSLINGPVDRPWGVRTALFADPDGHLWELAQ